MVLPAIGDPLALSTMLGFSDLDRDQWDPQDLKAMLRHQLAAPLYLGLGTLSAEVSQELRSSFPDQPRMTLGELFALEHPPLNVLMLVKQFAKMCRSDRTNPPSAGDRDAHVLRIHRSRNGEAKSINQSSGPGLRASGTEMAKRFSRGFPRI